jgi:hypothetical protein
MENITDYEQALIDLLAEFLHTPPMEGLCRQLDQMGFDAPIVRSIWGAPRLIFSHRHVPFFVLGKIEAGKPWDGVWLHLYKDVAQTINPNSDGNDTTWCCFLPFNHPSLIADDASSWWRQEITDRVCQALVLKRFDI